VTTGSLHYVWDYDISEDEFQQILEGRLAVGRLDQRWAAIRLLDYAPYSEIVRRLGFKRLVEGWPRWREHVRSRSRTRGLDFLVAWLPKNRPDLLR
jgi:hypothetical protein